MEEYRENTEKNIGTDVEKESSVIGIRQAGSDRRVTSDRRVNPDRRKGPDRRVNPDVRIEGDRRVNPDRRVNGDRRVNPDRRTNADRRGQADRRVNNSSQPSSRVSNNSRPSSRVRQESAVRKPVTPDERLQSRDEYRRNRMEQQRRKKQHKKRKIIIEIVTIIVLLLAIVGGVKGVTYLLQPKPMEEALEYFEAGSYISAIEQFELAIADEDSLGEAYIGLALCYWELGEYENMEVAFDNAYANGATMTGSSRNMLASVALQNEDYEAALAYIQAGLACEGNSDEVIQELMKNEITCYEAMADWEAAEVKLEVYLATYPDDADAVKEAEFLETR